MAKKLASTVTNFAWRCIALCAGFVLLTYGHQVISDSRVFGVYLMLCMFAIAIVYYQTGAKAPTRKGNELRELDDLSAFGQIKQLSLELAYLEDEFKEDMTRLERKWL